MVDRFGESCKNLACIFVDIFIGIFAATVVYVGCDNSFDAIGAIIGKQVNQRLIVIGFAAAIREIVGVFVYYSADINSALFVEFNTLPVLRRFAHCLCIVNVLIVDCYGITHVVFSSMLNLGIVMNLLAVSVAEFAQYEAMDIDLSVLIFFVKR